jgi:hypothetical protein
VLIDEGNRDPLTVPRPAAARHQRVHVRVPVAQVARSLDDGDHPRPHPLVAGAAHISSSTVSQAARASPPSSSRWCRKYGRSIFGMTKTHWACPTSSKHLLGQQRRRRRRPLRRARRAQLPGLARESEQVLLSAVGAPIRAKPFSKEPAVEVPQHLLVDEAAPKPVPPLEALLPLPPHLVEVGLEEPVEGRRAGIPGPVAGRAGLCHGGVSGLPQRGRAVPACLRQS